MLPIGLRDFLPEHDVATAAYVGLAGISNGEMLRRLHEENTARREPLTATRYA